MQSGAKNTSTVALISVIAALCLAIQLAPRPPNVEFTSLFTFTLGFLFGPLTGAFFGGFVMFVNGFLSPWGFAGLNMPFQMLGMGLVGLAGGLYRVYMHNPIKIESFFEIAILGAFLTVIYDVITNFGVTLFSIISGVSPSAALLSVFASGAPFSFVHVCSNIGTFGLIFIPLIRALNKFPLVRKIG